MCLDDLKAVYILHTRHAIINDIFSFVSEVFVLLVVSRIS